MSGLPTNGLPAATLPFSGIEQCALDTEKASGLVPQTVALTTQQMAAIGLGAVSVLTDAAVIAADASQFSQFSVTLGATGRTLTMSNASPGQEVNVWVKQDGTGSRTITTYTNVLWAAGTAPTLTTTAGATDVLRFTFNATLGKFLGETVAKAIA